MEEQIKSLYAEMLVIHISFRTDLSRNDLCTARTHSLSVDPPRTSISALRHGTEEKYGVSVPEAHVVQCLNAAAR